MRKKYGSMIQPKPERYGDDHPEMWSRVIDDIQDRNEAGMATYGEPLRAHNGRDALVDAYQEALDLVLYLRQAIYERDGEI